MNKPSSSARVIKIAAAAITSIFIVACSQNPDVVAKNATPILQKLIEKQFLVPAQFDLSDMKLIEVGKNTFRGVVTIKYYGITSGVPVSALSQGDTTIVNFSDPELIKSINNAKTAWLLGKNTAQVIDDQRFKTAFTASALKKWNIVKADGDVSGPISYANGYYYGWACMAHACGGDNNFAFVINADTGEGEMIGTSSIVGSDNKESVSAWSYLRSEMGGVHNLPAPLSTWLREENSAGYNLIFSGD